MEGRRFFEYLSAFLEVLKRNFGKKSRKKKFKTLIKK